MTAVSGSGVAQHKESWYCCGYSHTSYVRDLSRVTEVNWMGFVFQAMSFEADIQFSQTQHNQQMSAGCEHVAMGATRTG